MSGLIPFSNDANHPHAVSQFGSNIYSYDSNGNQVGRNLATGNLSLNYDSENRLVETAPTQVYEVTPTIKPLTTHSESIGSDAPTP